MCIGGLNGGEELRTAMELRVSQGTAIKEYGVLQLTT